MYKVNKERLSEKEKALLAIKTKEQEERIAKGEQKYMHKEKYAYMDADRFGTYTKEEVIKSSKDRLTTDLTVWLCYLTEKNFITIYEAFELAQKYIKQSKNPIISYFSTNYHRKGNYSNLVNFMSIMKLNYIDRKMLIEYSRNAEDLLNSNPELLNYYISRYYRREDEESLVDSYKAAKIKKPETIDEL